LTLLDTDRWREVYATLNANRLRTGLTAFGVSWGVFMLIVMLGAGTGLKNGVTQEFSGFAMNTLYLWTQGTSIPYKGLPARRWPELQNSDIAYIRSKVPEVGVIAPRSEGGGYGGSTNAVRGDRKGEFSVIGDYPTMRDLQPMEILEGRYLNMLDIQERRKVCVIGRRVRNTLYRSGEPIEGSFIRVNGVMFKVIGEFSTKKSGEELEKDEKTIFIPLTSFQQVFRQPNEIHYFGFMPAEGYTVTQMEDRLKVVLKEKHRVHPDDEFAFGTNNNEKEFADVNNVFIGINFLTWFVGVLTLLAGVIGVGNIMLVIIKERTKEIGIRRAIGASPWSIISQIMLESVVLTLVAGYTGLVAGVAVVEFAGPLMEDESFLNPSVDLRTALIALGVLVVSGCLAGLIPASKAMEVKPVEALRAEG